MRNDLVLLVEKKEFHVHRDVLCSYSPVFKAMLESDFREKRMEKIPLPGKSVQQVLEMLNFIYPFGHEINGRFSLGILEILKLKVVLVCITLPILGCVSTVHAIVSALSEHLLKIFCFLIFQAEIGTKLKSWNELGGVEL